MTYVNALTLFRDGHDTAEIAAILGCEEWTAYNEIHRLKQEERNDRIKREAAEKARTKREVDWAAYARYLRCGGRTFTEISEMVGVSPQRVHQVIGLVKFAGHDPSETQIEAAE